MTVERDILNLLAAAYTAQRDDHRAHKCAQVSDEWALRLLAEYLEESHSLLEMARYDLNYSLGLHSKITELREQLEAAREDAARRSADYQLLLSYLLQRYPG